MELDKIYSLIDKAEKSSFNIIEIKTEDILLRLERGIPALQAEPLSVAQAQPLPKTEKPVKTERNEYSEDRLIFAPISGVFYIAKEPGAAPFIKEGSKVKRGETVCIIEAMKTMNEICAPKTGVIEGILKEDSESVSAGEALFRYIEG